MTTCVAVGVILDNDQVFIALRPKEKHKGGFWEFPGGKIEAGENTLEALKRELKEEVDILFERAKPMMKIRWDYPDKKVILDVMLVQEFEGEPKGKEGQEVKWVPVADLKNYHFPEANVSIVEKLIKDF